MIGIRIRIYQNFEMAAISWIPSQTSDKIAACLKCPFSSASCDPAIEVIFINTLTLILSTLPFKLH